MEALPLLLALHFALNATDVALFGGSQVVDHIFSQGTLGIET
jgi:hypothetical protein